ncbi:MAG: hypothetical protein SPJ84_02665 [Fusobacterium gastrosuis]|uniref:hypothetical protein n=1 Tax=Fusobacterium TaxID=848 RepID=UPI0025C22591|nr:hypothetical protein [Fusobacterium sp.]MCI7224319.1 hypothetical protein [Fusobacterium sp.]MDY5794707.1 hypothetical protein [Fusobacterium gastrosuis]
MICQIKVEKGGIVFIASTLTHRLTLVDYKVIILSTDTQNNVYSLFNSNPKRVKGS